MWISLDFLFFVPSPARRQRNSVLLCTESSLLFWYMSVFANIRIVERKVFANINLSNEGTFCVWLFQFSIHKRFIHRHFIIGSLRERKGSRWSIRYFHSNHAIACPVIGSRGTSRTRSTAEEENQLLGDEISKQYCTTKLSFYAKEICATIIQVTSEYMWVEMIVVSVGSSSYAHLFCSNHYFALALLLRRLHAGKCSVDRRQSQLQSENDSLLECANS